jgi:hypothetical protein
LAAIARSAGLACLRNLFLGPLRSTPGFMLAPAPRAWLVLRNLFDTGLRPGVNEVSHFQAFDESQGSPEQVATAFTQLLPAWRNLIEVLN